jgi:prepilin-type N-terminal cleavage/methylation domain-containing protein
MNKGFSLVELLIVMAVSAILLTGAVSVFCQQSKTFAGQTQDLNTIQDTRVTMSLITQDLRMAGFKQSGSTIQGLSVATQTSIRVLSDLNKNGVIDPNTDEDISYTYSPDSMILTRNNQTVLTGVESFGLEYTLDTGAITTTPTNLLKVRGIKVSMIIRSENVDPTTQNYKRNGFTTEIIPRNLAY